MIVGWSDPEGAKPHLGALLRRIVRPAQIFLFDPRPLAGLQATGVAFRHTSRPTAVAVPRVYLRK